MNNFSQHTSRHRRILGRTVLAMVLACAIGSLTQCRQVGDTLTGPSPITVMRTGAECVRECNDQAKQATRAEEARHRAALHACRDLAPADRESCIEAENQLHDENIERIQRDRKACKRGCYNEGGGTGGR